MISCIIIEDQPPAQRIMQRYISDYSSLKLLGVFNDALSALEFMKTEVTDLIFLDIHLPKLSGIDFLSVLPVKPLVILTTAHEKYALKGFDLGVVDYLLKPFSFERFVQAMVKVEQLTSSKNNTISDSKSDQSISDNYIFIKSGYEYIKINYSDLMYITANGDYTFLHTTNSKFLVSFTLSYWNEHLPKKSFCQIHKSHIVNIEFVSKISGNYVNIKDSKIPIGRAFKDEFYNTFLNK